MRTIPNEALSAADVPGEGATLAELRAFAHTFDGYARWGSFQRCAEIANARDHGSLDTLRTCLFFEVRRWHHFGGDPDERAQAYWRELTAEIARRVRAREP